METCEKGRGREMEQMRINCNCLIVSIFFMMQLLRFEFKIHHLNWKIDLFLLL